jgi:hypothetical protein
MESCELSLDPVTDCPRGQLQSNQRTSNRSTTAGGADGCPHSTKCSSITSFFDVTLLERNWHAVHDRVVDATDGARSRGSRKDDPFEMRPRGGEVLFCVPTVPTCQRVMM